MGITLMAHQQRAKEIGHNDYRFAFWFDPGCGKTIATLAIIDDAKFSHRPCKTVVVCPKSIMETAWLRDAQHFPRLNVVCCWADTPARRRELIRTPGADVLVISPECFKKHSDDFIEVGCQRIVVDESSMLKNHKAQITKAVIRFADKMKSAHMLSGTPAPNCPTEYWGQLRAIQKGLVSDSFYVFAHKYFYPMKRRIGDKEIIVGWKLKESATAEWEALLKSAGWHLRKEDCLDLPPQVDETRWFDLSRDEREVYDGVDTELQSLAWKKGWGDITETNNILMRLRQATGGAFYSGEKLINFGSSKLSELVEVLEEIGPRQVVVWAAFTHEIQRIANDIYLKDRKCAIIDGSVPLVERTRRIADFQDGSIRYLICQPQAAGHGITLTAANYSIDFSLTFSYELYKQARDRIHRTGQNWPCTYIHLCARDTCDIQILKCVESKKTQAETIAAILARTHNDD